MTRTLASLLIALSAIFAAAHTRAQSPPPQKLAIIEWTDPKPINTTNMEVELSYELPNGIYSPARIEFVMPPGALLVGWSASPSNVFTHQESPPGTHVFSTTNPYGSNNSSTLGTLVLTIDLPTWETLDGAVFIWNASLKGNYTPPGGGTSALDIAATPRQTIATAVAQELGFWSVGAWTSKWWGHPILGPGLLVTYAVQSRALSWQPVAAGWEQGLTLGDGLYFVQAFSNSSNDHLPPGDGSLVLDEQPLPGNAGGTIRAHRATGDLRRDSNSDTESALSNVLFVEAFVPCKAGNGSDIIPLTNAQFLSADYAVTAFAAGDFRRATPPLLLPRTALQENIRTPSGTTGNACGVGGEFNNSAYDARRGEGRRDHINHTMKPPKAILPIEGMVVEIMPPGITDMGFGTVHPEFTGYYCVLPDVAAFSLDTFLSSYLGNQCKPTKPVDPSTTTHLVYYASAWGGGGSIGDAGQSFWVDIPIGYVPADQTQRNLEITGYFNGRANLDTDPELESLGDTDLATNRTSTNVDPYQDKSVRPIWSIAEPSVENRTNTLPNNSTTVGRGEFRKVLFLYKTDEYYSLALNPVISIDVPDGVVVAAPGGADPMTTTVESGGNCPITPPGVPIIVEPNPANRPLVWTVSDAAAPYRMNNYCIKTELSLWVNPAYPWIDGSHFDIVARIDADNEPATRSADAGSAAQRFTLQVPPGATAEARPACQQEQSGGAFQPELVVSTQNTGGVTLTNATATLRLPRTGVAGGTGDASFVGIKMLDELPSGATLEASNGGVSWAALTLDGDTWVAPNGLDASTVTHVRLTGFAVAPYTQVAYRVMLTSSAATDATLVGSSHFTSTQFPSGQFQAGAPFIVGGCRELLVRKFYDADWSSTLNAGDTLLSGWDFEVANGNVVINAGVTDATGIYRVVVPFGAYTVTETLPAGGFAAPVWYPTTPQGAASIARDVTVQAAQATTEVAFGGMCDCNDQDADLCDYSECMLAGAVANAADAFCSEDDRPTCVATSACGSVSCEPATGDCTQAGPDCSAVDHFIPVTNQAGQLVGNVRCVLRAGQAPNCDMENGRLKIFPMSDPSSNVCGVDP